MKKLLLSSIVLLLLCGCSSVINEETQVEENKSYEEELNFKSEDLNTAYDEYTTIVLADRDVNINEGGTYLLSGSLVDASIIVDCDEEVKLVLDNVDITSKEDACINIIEADKVTITTTKDSLNNLSDGSTRSTEYEKIDACIFSKADLVINGEGCLNIDGNYKHGIVSKDDLLITSGTINVKANKQGICGKDCLKIAEGTIVVEAGSDGLKSNNDEDEGRGYVYIAGGQISIDCDGQAVSAYNNLYIDEGQIDIINSFEGLEAAYITINGGTINIKASDDGMNASNKTNSSNTRQFGSENTNADISINGGTIYVNADGDGLDSNGTITINGGYTFIEGPTNDGDAAFDYETAGYSYGGELLAIGSSGMAENLSENSTNVSLLYNTNTRYAAGTTIVIYDASGEVVFNKTSTKVFNSILVSSSSFNVGDTIVIELNGEQFEQSLTSTVNGTGTNGGMGGMMMGGQGGNFNPNQGNNESPMEFDSDSLPDDFDPDDLPDDFDQSQMPDNQGQGARSMTPPNMPSGQMMPNEKGS